MDLPNQEELRAERTLMDYGKNGRPMCLFLLQWGK